MLLITATTRRLARWPMSTMVRASWRALSRSCIKAPLPHLTSSTMASAPAAIFLLMMLAAMSGRLGTVPVTSRRA